jgi:capsular polysaccharide biosynthesis protein
VELRTYWAILLRRAWIIALVVILVGLYSGYQYYHLRKTPGALKVYQSTVTVQIGLQATTKATDPSYADITATSEYLADTFINGPILNSPAFDQQVVNQINNDMGAIKQKYGSNPNLGDITNTGAIGTALTSTQATRAHALVSIMADWPTDAGAWAIAQAAGEVTAAHIADYVSYAVTINATPSVSTSTSTILPAVVAQLVNPASTPGLIPGPSASKPNLLIALVLVGLIIGIALAFLVEYLDDRIRNKETATQLLQLPIYGEVPHAPQRNR